jgi:histidinol-phosphate aminotransferase
MRRGSPQRLEPSAKFVFARHSARPGPEFATALRKHAVLVRHFDKSRIAHYLRITAGTEDHSRRLIAAASDILRT